ncbi:MAB_1171c family putative transporter [Streptomyces violascens]|uniref:MAB_1171c family putative transporter n=1 Tax=Streptomyces violascens TaxID=67381 RepID=UPI00365F1C71
MNAVLYPICAAIALAALLFKLRVLRTDRSTPQLAIVAMFAALFLTYLVSSPPVWVATSKAVGIVDFSGLFTQSCVIALTACQQILLQHLAHEPEVAWRKLRPRLTALAVVLIAMIVLFTAASSEHEDPNDFAVNKAQFTPAYLMIYLIAFAANQIDLSIMCWRHSKVAPSPWLRRGLLFNAVTLPFSLIYAGCRMADVVAGQYGTSGAAWEPVAEFAVAASAVCRTIGWTLPDWGATLSAAWQQVVERRAYRELEPLHQAVTAEAAVHPMPQGIKTDIGARLYRRLMDIRDAQWALRQWMEPQVTTETERRCDAVGLTGTDRAAVIEAAQLKFAIHRKRQGVEPSGRVATPLAACPEELAAELDFQRKLARAFGSSPIVQAVLDDCTNTTAPYDSKKPTL